jgi:hypothetical protein
MAMLYRLTCVPASIVPLARRVSSGARLFCQSWRKPRRPKKGPEQRFHFPAQCFILATSACKKGRSLALCLFQYRAVQPVDFVASVQASWHFALAAGAGAKPSLSSSRVSQKPSIIHALREAITWLNAR